MAIEAEVAPAASAKQVSFAAPNPQDRLVFEVDSVEVLELFSSGQAVAFHARQHGRYRGGLAGTPTGNVALQHLACNGIVHVQNGQISRGRVIRDRIGLRTRLRAGASS